MFIDTHAHLCDPTFDPDRPDVLARARSAGAAAGRAGYAPVYCIACGAEVARARVARDPQASRIHYLAPCERTVLRLRSYGVPSERISLTGFPLPLELPGNRSPDRLQLDLSRRLSRLDPEGRFWKRHGRSVTPAPGTAKPSKGRPVPQQARTPHHHLRSGRSGGSGGDWTAGRLQCETATGEGSSGVLISLAVAGRQKLPGAGI